MRDLFQVRTVNMSVAVWIGFMALVGIALLGDARWRGSSSSGNEAADRCTVAAGRPAPQSPSPDFVFAALSGIRP